MACMKLGSKSEAFQLHGQSWHCISGLASDVTIQIGEMSFHLHKFPLISRSGLLEKLIGELKQEEGTISIVQLGELPGGAKTFELIAKFCYGIKIELTASNVLSLRCAAAYLQMTEDYGEGNLINQTEVFLNVVFGSWDDTIKVLKTCEELAVLPQVEELHILSKCINSLAIKASADPQLLNCHVSKCNNDDGIMWNGITTANNRPQPMTDNRLCEDVSFLSLPFYKHLIVAVEAAGMNPEHVSGSLMFYATKNIPLLNGESSFNDVNHSKELKQGLNKESTPSEADQRALLEEIIELVPNQKGATPMKFLVKLLRTAMILQASPSCRESLEKRVGLELDQATLEDLLIPTMGNSVETLYDIDCFQRILDHFISMDQSYSLNASPCIMEESQLEEGSHSLTSITMVANLVDAYLADIATDVNLKFPTFQSIAAAIPDYARPLADGIYRAIDIYLKAHPWLNDTEREQICRLMNCQKLSLEACTHAAQNERLPLRVIVQVLFFEQLRLRTSISGWFFVSDNLDNSRNPSGVLDFTGDSANGRRFGNGDIRNRVSELEKECQRMRKEFQKMIKSRRSWNLFCRRKSQYV